MNFVYKNAIYPADTGLLKKLDSSAQQIFDILTAAGPTVPKMDDICRNIYYKFHLATLKGELTLCVYHIIWALAKVNKPLDQITMIDHGGGLGMMGIVAKKAGIGRVIYNDIDLKFLEAAQGIAHIAEAQSDNYLLGDISPFIEQMNKFQPSIDILVSHDVLEHIYNLDYFFDTLCSSKYCPRVIFSSSGANMFSPEYVLRTLPVQARASKINKIKRMTIIKNTAPNLTEKETINLATKTRFFIKNEIIDFVNVYKENKSVKIPKKIGANSYDPFKSNTVDPENGWWAEHLFNPFYLTKYLKKYGFTGKIMAGFHDGKRRPYILNPIIKMLGSPLALPIAGYYTVYVYKD